MLPSENLSGDSSRQIFSDFSTGTNHPILIGIFTSIAFLCCFLLIKFIFVLRKLANRTPSLTYLGSLNASGTFGTTIQQRNQVSLSTIHDDLVGSSVSSEVFNGEYEVSELPAVLTKNKFNPEHLKSIVAQDSLKTQICAICLEELGSLPISSGTCSHFMHTACLKAWLLKDVYSSCPVCRTRYKVDDMGCSRELSETLEEDLMDDLMVPSTEDIGLPYSSHMYRSH